MCNLYLHTGSDQTNKQIKELEHKNVLNVYEKTEKIRVLVKPIVSSGGGELHTNVNKFQFQSLRYIEAIVPNLYRFIEKKD